MLQKKPVNKFEWVKYNSTFDEGFVKSYNQKIKEGHFLEVHLLYAEN